MGDIIEFYSVYTNAVILPRFIIFKQMLGDEFITFLAIDLPQIDHILIFVKTTKEFIWGDRFADDPAWDYLESLGYMDIRIIAAKEIEGGLWNGSTD